MALRRIGNYLRLFFAIACLITCGLAFASEYHGQVIFNGVAVPGATVTATQDDKKFVAVTDEQGVFSFPDLTNGTWTIQVEMLGFTTLKDQVAIAANAPVAPPWELKMLAIDEIKAETKAVVAPAPAAPAAAPVAKTQPTKAPAKPGETKPPDAKAAVAAEPAAETDQRAADGFLINGSQNNGAASPFAQFAAFGNSRAGGRSAYNGSIAMSLDNSLLNASPFSQSGFVTPKPASNLFTGGANFGGPLRIPHVWKNGPIFNVNYQWTRNGVDTTQSGVVPTVAERGGDLSAFAPMPGQLFINNPATGLPFAGNMVPVSSQAAALLNLYPMPNVTPTAAQRFNYQVPILSNTHQDALQSRFTKTLNRRDTISGGFAFADTRASNPNLFGLVDTNDSLGINTNVTWTHRFGQHMVQTVRYQYSRTAMMLTPNFANRENISGNAGITGNLQDPTDWGPPTLSFLSVNPLSDGVSAHNRNETGSASYSMFWNRRNHNITYGADYSRREFNYLTQQDPRGTFTFNGAATAQIVNGVAAPIPGNDFADFLLGIPDTSSIAFGNADKYFRESVYDAFIDDDWKVTPQLSIHVGLRWEYGAPITELFDRLVNLDIAPDFSTEAPVLANQPQGPVGSVTSQAYPNSLVKPDKHGIEPRLSIAWRPISGSSIVVRAGYGITYDTSVYQWIALAMAQQAPLSKSLSVQNTGACPLTLANGFNTCPTVTPDNFAVDPNFRVGYLQTWNLSVQRDLPWSLQMTATYLGNKGTRGPQEFLPNTYPVGATNPCPSCPAGYAFLTSNGNSDRESGTLQVRRRLHNGLTATVQYTFSKSIDDDSALGGQLTASSVVPAQNWLNLNGERGLSTFDQRHLLNVTFQYTTGMGIGGKTLLSGWRGRLYKEWTVLTAVTLGSGLPETPSFPGAVSGTGFSTIRPELTGAPLYSGAPTGLFLNPAAYEAPPSGQFGDAGRDSITGPVQFSTSASMLRTFRMKDRLNLDLQIACTNPINHVTYANYVANVESSLFGTATAPNAMRQVTTKLRLRF
jgi:hypothetical protein